MDTQSYEAVLRTLADNSASLEARVVAIHGISEPSRLPLAQRLGLMRACLTSPDLSVRELGLTALGQHPSPKIGELLRDLLDDPCERMQAIALRELASRNDPRAYDVCSAWMCHGTAEQRQAAFEALLFLRGDRAIGLHEICWQCSDLPTENRIRVAVALLQVGNRIGESFLQQQLSLQSVGFRAFIAPELARLGDPLGLREMAQLAASSTPEDQELVRFLFWRSIGVPFDAPHAQWTAAVHAWLEQHCGHSAE